MTRPSHNVSDWCSEILATHHEQEWYYSQARHPPAKPQNLSVCDKYDRQIFEYCVYRYAQELLRDLGKTNRKM